MKGYFIALEGIDGCGKSTQINHLSKWLPISGLMPKNAKLHITREPGGTLLGQSIRRLLLNSRQEESPEPLTELLLYAADRAQHINQFIKPLVNKGDWVISDRFSGSTTAYQGYGRGLDINLIQDLERIATGGLLPDITLFLNISIETSLKRREAKVNDRIESEGKEFLEKVLFGFSEISKENNWITIAAEAEPTKVNDVIEKKLFSLLKNN